MILLNIKTNEIYEWIYSTRSHVRSRTNVYEQVRACIKSYCMGVFRNLINPGTHTCTGVRSIHVQVMSRVLKFHCADLCSSYDDKLVPTTNKVELFMVCYLFFTFTIKEHLGPKLFMTFSYQEYSTFTISVFV